MSGKLSTKFALAFLIAAIVFCAAVNVMADVYTGYLVDVTEAMQQELLLSHADYLSNKLKDMCDVLYRLSIDNDIRRLLVDMDDAFLYSSIQAKLWEYRSFMNDVVCVSVMNGRGTVITFEERLGRPEEEEALLSDEALSGRILEASKRERHVVLFPDTYKGSPVIHLALGMRDYYTGAYICTTVATVSVQQLSANIRTELPAGAEDGDLIQSMILINGSTIVAHPDPALINTEAPWDIPPDGGQGYREVAAEGRPDLRVISIPIDKYGTCLVSSLDKGILLDSVNRFRRMLLAVIVGVVLVILGVEFSVLLRFSRNLRALLSGIAEVEGGDFDARVELTSRDELRTVADHFNRMTARLKESRRLQTLHNQELLREEEKLREAEVKALEAQINSHFLYNVLNIINYNVIEAGADGISRMIKALSETLYFTFNKSMRSVRVKHEAEWLRQYLYLQQECHGKLFTFSVEVAPGAAEVPLKKLLVQPFAENSIAHGFYGRSYGGHIDIRFRLLRSGRLAVTVRDNGCGMPEAKAAQLRALFASSRPQEKMGVGIENVVFRIRRYYRSDARLTLQSSPHTGTKITMLLGSLQEIE